MLNAHGDGQSFNKWWEPPILEAHVTAGVKGETVAVEGEHDVPGMPSTAWTLKTPPYDARIWSNCRMSLLQVRVKVVADTCCRGRGCTHDIPRMPSSLKGHEH